MAQTKITIQLEPREMKIISDALIAYILEQDVRIEDPTPEDLRQHDGQLELFLNDVKFRQSEARAILNSIV